MNLIVKKYLYRICLVLLISTLVFSSCKNINLFEKNTNIPNLNWKNDFAVRGQFNIVDTTSYYNVFVVLRHTDAYKYNNIWLSVDLNSEGDSIPAQKINLILGSDAQGWEGAGMNDIWEVRKLITRIPLRKTIYNFSISQIMRDNPLQFIMSIGLRVEKVS